MRGGANIYIHYLVHKWSGHSVVFVRKHKAKHNFNQAGIYFRALE